MTQKLLISQSGMDGSIRINNVKGNYILTLNCQPKKEFEIGNGWRIIFLVLIILLIVHKMVVA